MKYRAGSFVAGTGAERRGAVRAVRRGGTPASGEIPTNYLIVVTGATSAQHCR
ncbi:hypothetical protein JYU34_003023 [Plutella xylostella]|uniref:Uncharacterized protein n=1 Tax=Plutella xylostella TaxID=51655 RepID=A0ABQ7QYY4_PLUXY|nr:hypothetical protein JYU34_003023 [Plutella xylostella]